MQLVRVHEIPGGLGAQSIGAFIVSAELLRQVVAEENHKADADHGQDSKANHKKDALRPPSWP